MTPFFMIGAFVLLGLTFAVRAEYVVHERRDGSLGAGTTRYRVRPDMLLPMRIALHQNKNANSNAEVWLKAVSDPDSSSFGRFWSQGEVIEAFKPADNTVDTVETWLSDNGVSHITHSDNKQWLAFDLPARQAEVLLKTKYYERVLPNGVLEISCESYMLPSELQPHVDFVKPGVKMSYALKRRPSEKRDRHRDTRGQQKRSGAPLPPVGPSNPPKNPNDLESCDREATPACVRALYGFETLDPSEPVSVQNAMGIFEEEDLYYQGDLDKFEEHLTNIPVGTTPIDLSIDGGARPPSAPRTKGWKDVGGEANLDIQSSLPIIYPQNVTIYQVDDRYYAHQVDYGYHGLEIFNDFLDAIDGSYCTYSAFGETGNDPKHDPKYPDSHPHGYKGKLHCGVFKPTNVISISYGSSETPHYYQKRQCNEWMKLALQGVSVFAASGDSGSACFIADHSDREMWFPEGPVGCPWITGVGATQIGRGRTVNDPEGAAEFNWAGISSGGGFSVLHEAPWYQKAALSRYFVASNNLSDVPYFENGKFHGNDGVYNRNGRGIPDISAIGSNIAVWNKDTYTQESGTSASAPIVAALFNRIIEARIRAGKRGPIGLVNPTLYKNPGVLNDITRGDNGVCVKHNRLLFGKKYGYNCTEAWDPVTGLGTPKYAELLKVFMDLP